jgi:hypothetical protein
MNILKTTFPLFAAVLLITSCKKDPIENLAPVVNAGKDTTFNLSLPKDSIRLSGSATDPDGTVVSYLWSQVSGPNTATITTPGSTSTFVDKVIAGTYVFQLMATDNKGATGVKSVSITVVPPQIISLTLQPHQNPDEILLALLNSQNVSDKAATDISAFAWTNGSITYGRSLYKFNLASLPLSGRLVSAKLTLYSHPTPPNGNLIDANFGTNNILLLQRVTGTWNANTVTWQTQPSVDATTQIVIPHANQSRLDLADVDVTNMVEEMRKLNNGFMIRLQTENLFNCRIFCSSKYTDATKHPKLVIEYYK